LGSSTGSRTGGGGGGRIERRTLDRHVAALTADTWPRGPSPWARAAGPTGAAQIRAAHRVRRGPVAPGHRNIEFNGCRLVIERGVRAGSTVSMLPHRSRIIFDPSVGHADADGRFVQKTMSRSVGRVNELRLMDLLFAQIRRLHTAVVISVQVALHRERDYRRATSPGTIAPG
jgi:hypothetical protein